MQLIIIPRTPLLGGESDLSVWDTISLFCASLTGWVFFFIRIKKVSTALVYIAFWLDKIALFLWHVIAHCYVFHSVRQSPSMANKPFCSLIVMKNLWIITTPHLECNVTKDLFVANISFILNNIQRESNMKIHHIYCPVSWGCRIHWLLLCRGVRPPPNNCPGYDTKQSDGKVPVIQVLWGMWRTLLLPSLPDPLWPGVVAPDRALTMV